MNTDESQPDTTAKSAAQAVGPITREQLYELVWTKPMLRVGEMFGVSSSYMARVCTELRVPRPGLGYWTQHEMGRAPQRAALPPAEPGDLTVWKPGLSVGNTQRVARKQVAAAPTAGGQSVHRPGRSSKKAALPPVHPLLKDVKPLFLKSREKSTGTASCSHSVAAPCHCGRNSSPKGGLQLIATSKCRKLTLVQSAQRIGRQFTNGEIVKNCRHNCRAGRHLSALNQELPKRLPNGAFRLVQELGTNIQSVDSGPPAPRPTPHQRTQVSPRVAPPAGRSQATWCRWHNCRRRS